MKRRKAEGGGGVERLAGDVRAEKVTFMQKLLIFNVIIPIIEM